MKQLQLLLLEDMVSDSDLIRIVLKRSGMDFVMDVVEHKEAFISALDKGQYDAILADHSLPQFSAAQALEIVNQRKAGIPFILVTGYISEEYAVQMIKDGASDYILKDRLQRLPSALQSAIDRSRLEAERAKYLETIIANEAMMKEAAAIAHFGSWEADLAAHTDRWSDEQYWILGYEPGEIAPGIDSFFELVHPDDRADVKKLMNGMMEDGGRKKCHCRIITKDGTIKHILAEMAVTRDGSGRPLKINGFTMDVSEARAAALKEQLITADLIQRNKDLEQFAYIISHNLRGPVANIVGISDVLIEDNVNETERANFLEALSASIKKLDGVIIDLNDILQVKNHINENKQRIDLCDMVGEIKAELSKAIAESGAIITCDFGAAKEMLTLKSYMHSIFYNLISNSIKFRRMDVPPTIEIYGTTRDEKTVLTFRDNGIGIDLEKRKNYVFGLYKRFHPYHAEGKGMGLFMVKTQVEALGGKIGIDSTINAGTIFTIEFETQNFAMQV